MNNLERDIKRVLQFYNDPPYSNFKIRIIYEKLNEQFFTESWSFMEDITDISEEFHREYCKYYSYYHWIRVIKYQSKVSEKFYEEKFHEMPSSCKAPLIKMNKVSKKFIKNNMDKIPPEVWRKVYE